MACGSAWLREPSMRMIHTHTLTCMNVHKHTCTYTHAHMHMHTCTHTHICTHAYAYTHTHTCTHACMRARKHTHTHRCVVDGPKSLVVVFMSPQTHIHTYHMHSAGEQMRVSTKCRHTYMLRPDHKPASPLQIWLAHFKAG